MSELQSLIAGALGAALDHLPDTIEFWSDPDTTESTSAPIANRGPFGEPSRTNQVAPAPQTGARKIDQCQGQLAPSTQKQGRVVVASTQIVPVAPWVISIPATKAGEWKLSKDDELRLGPRRFKVVEGGLPDSFSPLCLIYCEEQSSGGQS